MKNNPFIIVLASIFILVLFYFLLIYTNNKETFTQPIINDLYSIILTNSNNDNKISMLQYINNSTTINETDKNNLTLIIINYEPTIRNLSTISYNVPSNLIDVLKKLNNELFNYVTDSCTIKQNDKNVFYNYLEQITNNIEELESNCVNDTNIFTPLLKTIVATPSGGSGPDSTDKPSITTPTITGPPITIKVSNIAPINSLGFSSDFINNNVYYSLKNDNYIPFFQTNNNINYFANTNTNVTIGFDSNMLDDLTIPKKYIDNYNVNDYFSPNSINKFNWVNNGNGTYNLKYVITSTTPAFASPFSTTPAFTSPFSTAPSFTTPFGTAPSFTTIPTNDYLSMFFKFDNNLWNYAIGQRINKPNSGLTFNTFNDSNDIAFYYLNYNDSFNIGNFKASNTSFTVFFVLRYSSTPTSTSLFNLFNERITLKLNYSNQNIDYVITITDGNSSYYVKFSQSFSESFSNYKSPSKYEAFTNYFLNNDSNFVFVFKETSVDVYFNGTLNTNSINTFDANYNLKKFASSGGIVKINTGKNINIRNLGIYNRILTNSEIVSLDNNNYIPLYSNLIPLPTTAPTTPFVTPYVTTPYVSRPYVTTPYVTTPSPTANISDNLKMFYKFDNNLWNYKKGSSIAMPNSGVSFPYLNNNYYLNYNNMLNIGTFTPSNTSFTVFFIVRFSSTPTQGTVFNLFNENIKLDMNYSNNNVNYYITITDGSISYYFNFTEIYTNYYLTNDCKFVFVFKPNTIDVYFNGKLNTNSTNTFDTNYNLDNFVHNSSNNVIIGFNSYSIRNFGIYDRDLSIVDYTLLNNNNLLPPSSILKPSPTPGITTPAITTPITTTTPIPTTPSPTANISNDLKLFFKFDNNLWDYIGGNTNYIAIPRSGISFPYLDNKYYYLNYSDNDGLDIGKFYPSNKSFTIFFVLRFSSAPPATQNPVFNLFNGRIYLYVNFSNNNIIYNTTFNIGTKSYYVIFSVPFSQYFKDNDSFFIFVFKPTSVDIYFNGELITPTTNTIDNNYSLTSFISSYYTSVKIYFNSYSIRNFGIYDRNFSSVDSTLLNSNDFLPPSNILLPAPTLPPYVTTPPPTTPIPTTPIPTTPIPTTPSPTPNVSNNLKIFFKFDNNLWDYFGGYSLQPPRSGISYTYLNNNYYLNYNDVLNIGKFYPSNTSFTIFFILRFSSSTPTNGTIFNLFNEGITLNMSYSNSNINYKITFDNGYIPYHVIFSQTFSNWYLSNDCRFIFVFKPTSVDIYLNGQLNTNATNDFKTDYNLSSFISSFNTSVNFGFNSYSIRNVGLYDRALSSVDATLLNSNYLIPDSNILIPSPTPGITTPSPTTPTPTFTPFVTTPLPTPNITNELSMFYKFDNNLWDYKNGNSLTMSNAITFSYVNENYYVTTTTPLTLGILSFINKSNPSFTVFFILRFFSEPTTKQQNIFNLFNENIRLDMVYSNSNIEYTIAINNGIKQYNVKFSREYSSRDTSNDTYFIFIFKSTSIDIYINGESVLPSSNSIDYYYSLNKYIQNTQSNNVVKINFNTYYSIRNFGIFIRPLSSVDSSLLYNNDLLPPSSILKTAPTPAIPTTPIPTTPIPTTPSPTANISSNLSMFYKFDNNLWNYVRRRPITGFNNNSISYSYFDRKNYYLNYSDINGLDVGPFNPINTSFTLFFILRFSSAPSADEKPVFNLFTGRIILSIYYTDNNKNINFKVAFNNGTKRYYIIFSLEYSDYFIDNDSFFIFVFKSTSVDIYFNGELITPTTNINDNTFSLSSFIISDTSVKLYFNSYSIRNFGIYDRTLSSIDVTLLNSNDFLPPSNILFPAPSLPPYVTTPATTTYIATTTPIPTTPSSTANISNNILMFYKFDNNLWNYIRGESLLITNSVSNAITFPYDSVTQKYYLNTTTPLTLGILSFIDNDNPSFTIFFILKFLSTPNDTPQNIFNLFNERIKLEIKNSNSKIEYTITIDHPQTKYEIKFIRDYVTYDIKFIIVFKPTSVDIYINSYLITKTQLTQNNIDSNYSLIDTISDIEEEEKIVKFNSNSSFSIRNFGIYERAFSYVDNKLLNDNFFLPPSSIMIPAPTPAITTPAITTRMATTSPIVTTPAITTPIVTTPLPTANISNNILMFYKFDNNLWDYIEGKSLSITNPLSSGITFPYDIDTETYYINSGSNTLKLKNLTFIDNDNPSFTVFFIHRFFYTPNDTPQNIFNLFDERIKLEMKYSNPNIECTITIDNNNNIYNIKFTYYYNNRDNNFIFVFKPNSVDIYINSYLIKNPQLTKNDIDNNYSLKKSVPNIDNQKLVKINFNTSYSIRNFGIYQRAFSYVDAKLLDDNNLIPSSILKPAPTPAITTPVVTTPVVTTPVITTSPIVTTPVVTTPSPTANISNELKMFYKFDNNLWDYVNSKFLNMPTRGMTFPYNKSNEKYYVNNTDELTLGELLFIDNSKPFFTVFFILRFFETPTIITTPSPSNTTTQNIFNLFNETIMLNMDYIPKDNIINYSVSSNDITFNFSYNFSLTDMKFIFVFKPTSIDVYINNQPIPLNKNDINNNYSLSISNEKDNITINFNTYYSFRNFGIFRRAFSNIDATLLWKNDLIPSNYLSPPPITPPINITYSFDNNNLKISWTGTVIGAKYKIYNYDKKEINIIEENTYTILSSTSTNNPTLYNTTNIIKGYVHSVKDNIESKNGILFSYTFPPDATNNFDVQEMNNNLIFTNISTPNYPPVSKYNLYIATDKTIINNFVLVGNCDSYKCKINYPINNGTIYHYFITIVDKPDGGETIKSLSYTKSYTTMSKGPINIQYAADNPSIDSSNNNHLKISWDSQPNNKYKVYVTGAIGGVTTSITNFNYYTFNTYNSYTEGYRNSGYITSINSSNVESIERLNFSYTYPLEATNLFNYKFSKSDVTFTYKGSGTIPIIAPITSINHYLCYILSNSNNIIKQEIQTTRENVIFLGESDKTYSYFISSIDNFGIQSVMPTVLKNLGGTLSSGVTGLTYTVNGQILNLKWNKVNKVKYYIYNNKGGKSSLVETDTYSSDSTFYQDGVISGYITSVNSSGQENTNDSVSFSYRFPPDATNNFTVEASSSTSLSFYLNTTPVLLQSSISTSIIKYKIYINNIFKKEYPISTFSNSSTNVSDLTLNTNYTYSVTIVDSLGGETIKLPDSKNCTTKSDPVTYIDAPKYNDPSIDTNGTNLIYSFNIPSSSSSYVIYYTSNTATSKTKMTKISSNQYTVPLVLGVSNQYYFYFGNSTDNNYYSPASLLSSKTVASVIYADTPVVNLPVNINPLGTILTFSFNIPSLYSSYVIYYKSCNNVDLLILNKPYSIPINEYGKTCNYKFYYSDNLGNFSIKYAETNVVINAAVTFANPPEFSTTSINDTGTQIQFSFVNKNTLYSIYYNTVDISYSATSYIGKGAVNNTTNPLVPVGPGAKTYYFYYRDDYSNSSLPSTKCEITINPAVTYVKPTFTGPTNTSGNLQYTFNNRNSYSVYYSSTLGGSKTYLSTDSNVNISITNGQAYNFYFYYSDSPSNTGNTGNYSKASDLSTVTSKSAVTYTAAPTYNTPPSVTNNGTKITYTFNNNTGNYSIYYNNNNDTSISKTKLSNDNSITVSTGNYNFYFYYSDSPSNTGNTGNYSNASIKSEVTISPAFTYVAAPTLVSGSPTSTNNSITYTFNNPSYSLYYSVGDSESPRNLPVSLDVNKTWIYSGSGVNADTNYRLNFYYGDGSVYSTYKLIINRYTLPLTPDGTVEKTNLNVKISLNNYTGYNVTAKVGGTNINGIVSGVINYQCPAWDTAYTITVNYTSTKSTFSSISKDFTVNTSVNPIYSASPTLISGSPTSTDNSITYTFNSSPDSTYILNYSIGTTTPIAVPLTGNSWTYSGLQPNKSYTLKFYYCLNSVCSTSPLTITYSTFAPPPTYNTPSLNDTNLIYTFTNIPGYSIYYNTNAGSSRTLYNSFISVDVKQSYTFYFYYGDNAGKYSRVSTVSNVSPVTYSAAPTFTKTDTGTTYITYTIDNNPNNFKIYTDIAGYSDSNTITLTSTPGTLISNNASQKIYFCNNNKSVYSNYSIFPPGNNYTKPLQPYPKDDWGGLYWLYIPKGASFSFGGTHNAGGNSQWFTFKPDGLTYPNVVNADRTNNWLNASDNGGRNVGFNIRYHSDDGDYNRYVITQDSSQDAGINHIHAIIGDNSNWYDTGGKRVATDVHDN
jgi:hypothetical protein